MVNRLTINDIIVTNNKIEIKYTFSGDWSRIFKSDTNFWAEYASDISNVPKSVAVIPFLGSVLPMAWVYDSEILVDEIDKAFYECLPNVLDGFKKMYPDLNFGGKIIPNTIIENNINCNKSAALFSGGLDAFDTLISHYSEKPMLATIWGADVDCDNIEGWEKVSDHIKMTSQKFKLPYEIVQSNLRKIYNNFNSELNIISGDNLWHGFQHGLGMLTLLAPLAFVMGINKVYIASSFTATDWGKYTCASDPVIDNEIKYVSCSVQHDGYQYTRQDKIRNICKFSKDNSMNIPLRVCWESKDGGNCCNCEKCCRTLLGLYAEKVNPELFGFDFKGRTFSEIIKNLENYKFKTFSYYAIQESLKKNYKIRDVDKAIRWFYRLNFDKQDIYYIHNKPKEYTFKEEAFRLLPTPLKKLYKKIKHIS